MITNFSQSDNFKTPIQFYIPKKTNLIENYDIFRLTTIYLCTFSLFVYSYLIIAVFTLLVALYFTAFFVAKLIVTIAIKQYIALVRKVQKIYFTPTMTESGQTVYFTFISPSETLLKRIQKLDSALNLRHKKD